MLSTHRITTALLICLGVTASSFASAVAAGAAPARSSWTAPVDAPVVERFRGPPGPYAAGHRGVDYAVAPGTPVRAAGDGVVAFAGPVGGARHVVVAHAGDLRTTYSFLAAIRVHSGDHVGHGDIIGWAGGPAPGHPAGVLHFGVRLGDTYIDPARLFATIDVADAVHLVPTRAERDDSSPPDAVLERRLLARTLGTLTARPEFARAAARSASAARAVRDAARLRDVRPAHDLRAVVPIITGLHAAAVMAIQPLTRPPRCTRHPPPADGHPATRHVLVRVAGISSTSERAAVHELRSDLLGYAPDEIVDFSYRFGSATYSRADTFNDIAAAAWLLRRQLRAFAARAPGREVDLLGHSMGGVVVHAFLALFYDPADPTLPPIGGVVTLGAPHHGAPLASIARTLHDQSITGMALTDIAAAVSGGRLAPAGSPAVHQLAEDSAFLARVASRPTPDQIEITSISGTDDAVVPARNTRLAGAHNVTLNPRGPFDHRGLVRDQGTLPDVALALRREPARCQSVPRRLRNAFEPLHIATVERFVGNLALQAVQFADAELIDPLLTLLVDP